MVPHVVLLTIAFSVASSTSEFTMRRCCCEAQVRDGLEVNDVFLTQHLCLCSAFLCYLHPLW